MFSVCVCVCVCDVCVCVCLVLGYGYGYELELINIYIHIIYISRRQHSTHQIWLSQQAQLRAPTHSSTFFRNAAKTTTTRSVHSRVGLVFSLILVSSLLHLACMSFTLIHVNALCVCVCVCDVCDVCVCVCICVCVCVCGLGLWLWL